MVEDNSLDMESIKERQGHDEELMQSIAKYPTWCSCKTVYDVDDILCYTKSGDNPANWKTCIT
jgi:hypothetical protein